MLQQTYLSRNLFALWLFHNANLHMFWTFPRSVKDFWTNNVDQMVISFSDYKAKKLLFQLCSNCSLPRSNLFSKNGILEILHTLSIIGCFCSFHFRAAGSTKTGSVAPCNSVWYRLGQAITNFMEEEQSLILKTKAHLFQHKLLWNVANSGPSPSQVFSAAAAMWPQRKQTNIPF